MDFVFFLIINALLFLRPSELFALGQWPLYESAMLLCLLMTYIPALRQLSIARLLANPITCCLLGLSVAVVLSLLSHGVVSGAFVAGFDFVKILLYYLLLVAILNTVTRLEHFLVALLWLLTAVGSIPLLQMAGITIFSINAVLQDIAYDAQGQSMLIPRLQSVCLDPNDLAMLVVTGILLCGWRVSAATTMAARCFWSLPLALLGYVLALTQSRGGLFSLLAGGLVLFHARYGIRKTIVAAMLSAAMIMVGVGGRMTDISALESGTGQSRVQMWSAGLQMLRDDPLFGVGYGTYLEHAAEAAHNSFVHCFAELGLLGGTFFLGAFGSAIWMLMCMAYVDDALNTEGATLDTRLVHMRRYLLAIVIAYVVGMFSLSRSYVVPTYMIVGLCTSWLRLAGSRIEIPRFQFDRQLVWHMVIADVMFLTGIYGFVQIFVRWS